jgi:CRISPR system Cascade subunit CasE
MFISRLILNPKSYYVQTELADIYQMHRTIMYAFPNKIEEKSPKERILFQINQEKLTNEISILIQSFEKPNWAFLEKKHDYFTEPPQIKQFNYPQFKAGQKFWFKLVGNPTKKLRNSDNMKKQYARKPISKEEDQFEWISSKAQKGGFNLIKCLITQKKIIKGKTKKQTHKLSFLSVQFEGVLEITDPKLFSETIINGIGSAKGFGFGFLTISKI